MVTDPKPERRIRANSQRWTELRLEKGGPCRLCDGKLTSLHHLVPRSLGGDDVAANLVPLCGTGTTGCHGRIEANDPVARRLLGDCLSPAEIAYVFRRKGPGFLSRYYRLEVAA